MEQQASQSNSKSEIDEIIRENTFSKHEYKSIWDISSREITKRCEIRAQNKMLMLKNSRIECSQNTKCKP